MEQNTVQKPDCAAITAQARPGSGRTAGGCTPARRGYFCSRLLFQRDRWRAYWQGQQHGSRRGCAGGYSAGAQSAGVYLAAQCCEHLNRAIVIEQEAAEKYGYEQVNAVPQPHAGGSWATNCWQAFEHPVLVEEVRAAAGIDIGGTLIGMHLKRVAVPVRLTIKQIGAAPIICARTRPKYIGGQPRRLPGDVNHADTGTTDNDGRKCGPHP